jgi:rSAM/selenodomain-associated transferase 1
MPQLTAQQAVDVHIELTERTLSLLHKAQLCPVQLCCMPDTAHPFFHQCADKYNVSLVEQQGKNLGERMQHAIASALASSSSVLLIGSDCPSFKAEDFESAIQTLRNNKDAVVIAPAEDGGYTMIAMNQSSPALFTNMTWGHDKVLYETIKRIGELDLTLFESRQQWDIDTFEDFQRYRKNR